MCMFVGNVVIECWFVGMWRILCTCTQLFNGPLSGEPVPEETLTQTTRCILVVLKCVQRNLTETQKDAVVKDFNSLNLTMYVGEMVSLQCGWLCLLDIVLWFSRIFLHP